VSAAFLDEAFHAARAEAHRRPGQRLDPAIRFVLDELPNLCPLDHLDTYVSEGRGAGLPVTWVAQTKEQLIDRYGPAKANSIIDATEVMLYGGGADTPGLYESISARIGDTPIARTSRQHDPWGNTSTATVHEHRPIMTPADLYGLHAHRTRRGVHRYGEAMMMSRQARTVVQLTPWWTRRDAEQICEQTSMPRP
jgi:type IV secretory pathway TraG/TraD family ATPase VirD4